MTGEKPKLPRSRIDAKRPQDKAKRRKPTEEALRESEELFRRTFENAAVGIAHVTPDGRWLRVNDKLCQILGYTRQQLLAKTFQEITHPDDVDTNLELLKRALAGEIETYAMEKRYIRNDGSIMWSNLTVSLIRHRRTHEPLYFISVIEEITARKQAEEQLRQSEERYRTLVETGTSVILGLTTDYRIFEWNRAAERIFGWPREEALGKNYLTTFLGEEVRKMVEADIGRVLAGHTTEAYENAVVHRDGSRRTLLWNVCRLLDGQGAAVGILAVGQDITERKQAEEALRESEERLRLALDGGALGTWHLDIATGAVIRDRRAEAIIGLSTGTSHDERAFFNAVHPDDRDKLVAARRQSIAKRREYVSEFRVQRPDGSVVWVLNRSKPFYNESGEVVRLSGICMDITERKRAEGALQRINEDLERRVAERTTELIFTQAQLRALAGRLHVLQEEERSELARELHDEFGAAFTALKVDLHWIMARLPEHSDGLEEKARVMSELIDNSVDSVRRTAGLLRPRLLDDFGLVAAIEWQIEEFQRRTGIQCVTSFPEEVEINRAISTAIFRILQEALTNVARHAEATEVRVGLQVDNDRVCIEIEDNGKGIDFDANANDTSLGLFGMQERAYAFGGHVQFDSQPHRGTTVTVEIPLERKA